MFDDLDAASYMQVMLQAVCQLTSFMYVAVVASTTSAVFENHEHLPTVIRRDALDDVGLTGDLYAQRRN